MSKPFLERVVILEKFLKKVSIVGSDVVLIYKWMRYVMKENNLQEVESKTQQMKKVIGSLLGNNEHLDMYEEIRNNTGLNQAILKSITD